MASADRRVRVLDAHGQLVLTLPELAGGVLLCFAFDGRELLTVSPNGDLRVWPLHLEASGEQILRASPYQFALDRARAATPVAWVEPAGPIDRYVGLVTAHDPTAIAFGTLFVDRAIGGANALALNELAWRIVDPQHALPAADRDLPLARRAAEAAVAITERANANVRPRRRSICAPRRRRCGHPSPSGSSCSSGERT